MTEERLGGLKWSSHIRRLRHGVMGRPQLTENELTFKHLNDQDRDEIWDLHGQGYLPTEIHKKTGRAYATVVALIVKHGGVRPARPRATTGKRLSDLDREDIAFGVASGDTYVAIGDRIGRHHSTVSREVSRNGGRQKYRAALAHKTAAQRAKRPKLLKLETGTVLGEVVRDKLAVEWSPEQISAWLKIEHPGDESMHISPESIYVAIHTRTAGMTAEHARCLRSGRKRRRPPRRKKRGRDKRGHNPNMVSITERPAGAADRSEAGHWEGDLIFGTGHQRAIGTLVERVSRYTLLVDFIAGVKADDVANQLARLFADLDPAVRRTLTWDQGYELAAHQEFTTASGIPVFFCDPRSPWQRPTNENTNGLLRQYFPKKTSIAHVTRADLDLAEQRLNTRPRQTLNWLTPAQRLAQLCATTT
jgi:transposase, IS30 family